MEGHEKIRELYKHWGLRIALIATATVWLAIMAASWAEGAEGENEVFDAYEDGTPEATRGPASAKDGGEYNFQWLDPDKQIYVLQNRKFVKTRRFQLSLMGGTNIATAYRNTYDVAPRAAFYFSEQFGVEGFYTHSFNTSNDLFESLEEATATGSALPVLREIRGQFGLLAHWSPWYAKINVFNKILYFDWYFTAGPGMLRTALNTNSRKGGAANFVDDNRFAGFIGTGHQYHLSQYFTVRWDFTSAIYWAPAFGNRGDTTWFTNYNFGLGVGLRL